MLLGNSSQEQLLIIPAMNITDQILDAANSSHRDQRIAYQRKAEYLNGKKLSDFYEKEFSLISQLVQESNFHNSLPLSRIEMFDSIEFIIRLIRKVFRPNNISKELNPIKEDSYDLENEKDTNPDRYKIFNYAKDTEIGVELVNYLTNLFTLRWLKHKMGYDTNQYPYNFSLIAFEQDEKVYILDQDKFDYKRLYIADSGSSEIMETYWNIIYHEGKVKSNLITILENTSFVEGMEAQKLFDLYWYKNSKQTPLTYRCFPKISYIRVSPEPGNNKPRCAGEYSIDIQELEERYDRFIAIYNQIESESQRELLSNTIYLFDKFIKRDNFEKDEHKSYFEIVKSKLNTLNDKLIEQFETALIIRLSKSLSINIVNDCENQLKQIELSLESRYDREDKIRFSSIEKEKSFDDIDKCSANIAPYIKMYIRELSESADKNKQYFKAVQGFLSNEYTADIQSLATIFRSIEEIENISEFNCMFYLTEQIIISDRIKYYEFLKYILSANKINNLSKFQKSIKTVNLSLNQNEINNYISPNRLNDIFYKLDLFESKSHEAIKTLCQGFCIYIIWTSENNENIKEVFKKYPRYDSPEEKALFFNAYVYPFLEKEKNTLPTFEVFNQNTFINKHIETELENFQKLKNIKEYEPPISLKTINNWLNEYIKYLVNTYQLDYETEKNKKSSKIIKQNKKEYIKKVYTLKWNRPESMLLSLYHDLSDKRIIITDVETFKKAFSGELIDKPLKIIWNLFADRSTKPEIVGLFYFLDKIKSSFSIISKKGKKEKSLLYDAVCHSFINANGEDLYRKTIRNRSNSLFYNCVNSELIDEAIKQSRI